MVAVNWFLEERRKPPPSESRSQEAVLGLKVALKIEDVVVARCATSHYIDTLGAVCLVAQTTAR